MARPDKPNGCYDRKPFQTYSYVQDGWVTDNRATAAVQAMDSGPADGLVQSRLMVRIPLRWSNQCMYDNKAADPRCADCKHQKE